MFCMFIHRFDVMYQRVYRQDVALCDNVWYVDFHMTYTIYEKLCDVLKSYREALSVQRVIALVLVKLTFDQSNCNARNEF
jgi:hypothetical protein